MQNESPKVEIFEGLRKHGLQKMEKQAMFCEQKKNSKKGIDTEITVAKETHRKVSSQMQTAKSHKTAAYNNMILKLKRKSDDMQAKDLCSHKFYKIMSHWHSVPK